MKSVCCGWGIPAICSAVHRPSTAVGAYRHINFVDVSQELTTVGLDSAAASVVVLSVFKDKVLLCCQPRLPNAGTAGVYQHTWL